MARKEAHTQSVEGEDLGGALDKAAETINVVAELLKNLLAKKGLKGLPEVLNHVESEPVASKKADLVDEALKAIKGREAEEKINQNGTELQRSLLSGDKNGLQTVLKKLLGDESSQDLVEKETSVAIIGWFEEAVPATREQKLEALKAKSRELNVDNDENIAKGLDVLDKQEGLPEKQQKQLLNEIKKAAAIQEFKQKKSILKKVNVKVEKQLKEVKRIKWRDTEKFRDRVKLEAIYSALKMADSGEMGVLDKGDLRELIGPEMLGLDESGRVKLGEVAERLFADMEPEEKKMIVEVLHNIRRSQEKPNNQNSTRPESKSDQGSSLEDGGFNPEERMGRSQGLSRDEFLRLKDKFNNGLSNLDLFDDVDKISPDELMRRMMGGMSGGMEAGMGRLHSKIMSSELQSYLFEDQSGYLRIRPEMIATEPQKEKFKELYFDMAVQAARKMFNTRVNSQGMDVYYDPNAMEYIAIKAIQGVFDIDPSMIDAVKLRASMLYLGDAMEGGYHDPKAMLEILSGAEKPGKYFLKTLRRTEGFYYTDENGNKEQLCRLNTYDLQKMIEQTCLDDTMYPAEANHDGGIERRRWLTMLLRESNSSNLDTVDGKFLTAAITDKIGINRWNSLSEKQRVEVLTQYNTVVKDIILYEAITDRIGECFENASFGMQKDKSGNEIGATFNLPQRIPEMWYKNSRTGVRFFILKYGAANMLEFTKVIDNILPSYFLYRHETMTHLVDAGVVAETFFNGNETHSKKFGKMMEEAIVTWNLGDSESDWLEFGIKGRKDTAMRRSNVDVSQKLLSLDLSRPENLGMVSALDFAKFTQMTGINILGESPKEKWIYFAKNYNDGYYNTNNSPAKGWADWLGKFKGEKAWGMYEVFMQWAANPLNSEHMAKVWGAISSYTPPDGLWAKYDEFIRSKGAKVGALGYYTTVKRDASGKLAAWKKDGSRTDTALPVPQMKVVTGAEMAFSQHGGKNQIEAETKYETPDIELMLNAVHKDMAKQGWATQDEKWTKRSWNKVEEILAPNKNWYINLASDILVLPILVRMLKKVTGFHDDAQFWHWLLIEPLPDALQNMLEIFGIKFKLK